MSSPPHRLRLQSRLVLGACAGFAATLAMTATMRRLHQRLPHRDRYPLPPREITERLLPGLQGDAMIIDTATAAHHAYGAISGALVAAVLPNPGIVTGALAGVGVWAASYLGWLPATGVLTYAQHHPARRNASMIVAHVVWGSATGLGYRELLAARTSMLRQGPLKDAGPAPLAALRA